MKRTIFGILATSVFVFLFAFSGSSQGTTGLRVAAMTGYPMAPQDSAYEGQQYTFVITLVNNSGTVINTPIDVRLQVDSIDSLLGTFQAPALGINDSALFTIVGYNFTQPQYKIGNNIVVVWPVVNGLVIPIDTFYADVFFIPLSSLSDKDLEINKIALFPVPSNSNIQLSLKPNDEVEYVRIFSTEGRMVYENREWLNQSIDIRNLPCGTYLLEALINGKKGRARFIRN